MFTLNFKGNIISLVLAYIYINNRKRKRKKKMNVYATRSAFKSCGIMFEYKQQYVYKRKQSLPYQIYILKKEEEEERS